MSLSRKHKQIQRRDQKSTAQPDQDGDGFSAQAEPAALVQKAQADGVRLSPREVLQLQRTLGNQAVGRLIQRTPQQDEGFTQHEHAQANIEVEQKTGDLHTPGCGCPSCRQVQMQRDISAQKTDAPLIQREIITDWVADSTIKGTVFGNKTRSPDLITIDSAVAAYSGSRTATLNFANIGKLQLIKTAIANWRKQINKKDNRRKGFVTQLETLVDQELKGFQDRQAEEQLKTEAARPAHTRFHTLSGDMGDFAGRDTSYKDVDRFREANMGDRLKALTKYRNEDGTMSDEGIAEMNRLDTEQLKDKNLKAAETATMTVAKGVTKEQLQGIMDKHKNPVTGKTMYPELESLVNPSDKADKVVTEAIDVHGVTMTVTYNEGDANFDSRISMLKAAVAKIKAAGFPVPALEVHLPKLGRAVNVTGECVITTSAPTERAVYVAPNFMHISSENMGNPLDTKASHDKSQYKFSSTAFDPSGVGTIVHEFGHALHYTAAPGKFHELWGSQFKGKDVASNKAYDVIAQEQVSDYGTKPREFVAEVFLGMVYGRVYSKLVMDMYKRFGGKMPGG